MMSIKDLNFCLLNNFAFHTKTWLNNLGNKSLFLLILSFDLFFSHHFIFVEFSLQGRCELENLVFLKSGEVESAGQIEPFLHINLCYIMEIFTSWASVSYVLAYLRILVNPTNPLAKF